MLIRHIRDYYRSIPQGIRVISFATAIRWFGWGMVNPLVPVFLFAAIGSYALSGIVDSMGRFVFVLLLPLAGRLADRMDLKKFLIAGLIFFVFDGFGYFIGGLTGAVAWIFFANILDGAGVLSDVIGRSTYVRRYAPAARVSTIFGFSNLVINAGYIAGIVASVFLANVWHIAWIFFALVPTTLIALAMYARYLKKEPALPEEETGSFWRNYLSSWRDAVTWNADVKVLAALALFLSVLDAVGVFIIPIFAHLQGADLGRVALIGAVFNLPWLFAEPLGRLADHWREKTVPWGMAAIALTLAAFAVFTGYVSQLVLVLVLEIFIILTGLAIEGIATHRVPPERFGRISAVIEGVKDFGKFLGPLLLGIALDLSGSRPVFIGAAVVTLAAVFLLRVPKQSMPAASEVRL